MGIRNSDTTEDLRLEGTFIEPEALGQLSEGKDRLTDCSTSLAFRVPHDGDPADIVDAYPLTPLQEGMLLHHIARGEKDSYVLSLLFEIQSERIATLLTLAVQKIVDVHDALRASIHWEGLAQPLQFVHRCAKVRTERFILSETLSAADQLQELTHPTRANFNLANAPLLRLVSVSGPNGDPRFAVLQLHHLICDYQSMRRLVAAIVCYISSGQLPPGVPCTYKNYVQQSRCYSNSPESRDYFRRNLGDFCEPSYAFGVSELPGRTFSVEESRHYLDVSLSSRLHAIAKQYETSPARIFHAACALMLARSCGRNDVVFGTSLQASRLSQQSAETPIGLAVNTLPLRIQLPGITAAELVRQVDTKITELLKHRYSSLAVARGCSSVPGSVPLFNTLLTFRHSETPRTTEWAASPGIKLVGLREAWTDLPLTIIVDQLSGTFRITVQANSDVVPQTVSDCITAAVDSLVSSLERAPSTPALTLSILSETARAQVLQSFNRIVDSTSGLSIHNRIARHVACKPDASAVSGDGFTLTFGELDRRASQLAAYLTSRGIGADSIVGICLERSPELVIGLLGILRAGAAYLPIDANYPTARLEYMLKDSAAGLVLTQYHIKQRLPTHNHAVLSLDRDWREIAASPLFLSEPQDPDQNALSYVIYTSGSTGTPKAAQVSRKGFQNLIDWYLDDVGISADDAVLLVTSQSFDLTQKNIFAPLATGGQLVLAAEPFDAESILHQIGQRQITHINLAPSVFYSLVDADIWGHLANLRRVILGGEPIRPEKLMLSHKARPTFINSYGPTECSDVVAFHILAGSSDAARNLVIPIGVPIRNTRLYILDALGQPVPLGVVGEIYIGGECVGRGYLNRPEITAERFLADPFSSVPSARMYRTGDMGLWRPNGTIEYRGRIDHQIKIRGFRIEPGEIESQLRRHSEVEDAAVVAGEYGLDQRRLIAYVIPKIAEGGSLRPPNAKDLWIYLKSFMPDHMVPAAFVIAGSLPLTPNGKLDRLALPTPGVDSFVRREYEPPQGNLEAIVAKSWQTLLGADRIGRFDNFFELGGHSLLIVKMLEQFRTYGFTAEARCIYESTTLAQLAGSLTECTAPAQLVPPNLIPHRCNKITPDMLTLVTLTPEEIELIERSVDVGPENIQDIYPLAPLQEGLLLHHLLNSESEDPYVRATLFELSSREDLDAFIDALRHAVARHDVLRSAVLWEELPLPLQVVHRTAALTVTELTLEGDHSTQKQLIDRINSGTLRLDIRRAPLLRLEIAPDADGCRWYAILLLHHLISDNESMAALLSELVATLGGHTSTLPRPVPYRSHVAQAMAFSRNREAKEYFSNKLGDVDETTAPFGLTSIFGDKHPPQDASLTLDSDLALKLRLTAKDFGVTAATIFHTAWALVVAATSGRSDVVYGTVLSGRLQTVATSGPIIGMRINTLPLRINIADTSASALVRATHQELTELLTHEQASLAVARQCCAIPGSAPLFTALLNYVHSEASFKSEFEAIPGISVLMTRGSTNYPLVLSINDRGVDGFELRAETRLIEPQRVLDYTVAGLRGLLESLKSDPDSTPTSISILPPYERALVYETFPGPRNDFLSDKLVHEILEGQVRLTPDSVALAHESHSLTYRELNARANRLARHLRHRGITTNDLVGLCTERGLQSIIGLLGILKAGAAYVPLDPDYPAERLAYILGDASPAAVVTDSRTTGKLPDTSVTVIDLDRDWGHISSNVNTNLALRPSGLSSRHLAYIIYTSGSTGAPKGVMVEHRNVTRLFYAAEKTFALGSQDVWTVFHSVAFDFSVWELWGALLYGGTAVLVSNHTARSPDEFYRLLCARGVTVLNQTPSAFVPLSDTAVQSAQKHSLRLIIFGGEALDFHKLAPWVDRYGTSTSRLVNMYGITETTVHVTYHFLNAHDIYSERGSVIGVPLEDLEVRVLNKHMMPCPVGVTGEIYVAGAGVTRGYLNRPELTASRFLRSPFSSTASRRLYMTGDLGRWRSDGTLEYLGRNDRQVKIRGYRIELGEIEARLSQYAPIKNAAVAMREDPSGEKRLVAYVTQNESRPDDSITLTAADIRTHLKGVLPDHMIPSAFIVLDELPLTPSGKLDHRQLPPLEPTVVASTQYEAPEGDVETRLAAIWRELLGVARVGRRDDFFQIGGHSLLAIQVAVRATREFGVEVQVVTLFEHPTLQQYGRCVAVARQARLHNALARGGDPIRALLEQVSGLPDDRAQQLLQQLRSGSTTQ